MRQRRRVVRGNMGLYTRRRTNPKRVLFTATQGMYLDSLIHLRSAGCMVPITLGKQNIGKVRLAVTGTGPVPLFTNTQIRRIDVKSDCVEKYTQRVDSVVDLYDTGEATFPIRGK